MSKKPILLMVPLFSALACGIPDSVEDSTQPNSSVEVTPRSAIQTTDFVAVDGKSGVVHDRAGHEWSVRSAPFIYRKPGEPHQIEDEPPPDAFETPEESHDFRAIKYLDGLEYTELKISPEFEVARANFKANSGGYLLPGTHGQVTRPQPKTLSIDDTFRAKPLARNTPTDINTTQLLIVGTDDRHYSFGGYENYSPLGPNQNRSAQVIFNEAGCSGTMIGTYTAISAAHCFYDRATASTPAGWNYTALFGTWGLGRIQTVSGGIPSVSYTYGYVTGCFSVTVSSWYATAPTYADANVDDFALVEFTCGLTPGANGNHFDPAYTNAAGYASSYLASLSAYDGDGSDPMLPAGQRPPQYPYPYTQFRVPTLVQRKRTSSSGSTMVLQSNGVHMLGGSVFDLAGGASGGGLIMTPFHNLGDDTPCWVANLFAVHRPSGTYTTSGTTDARANFRVLTGGQWGWIVNASNEF